MEDTDKFDLTKGLVFPTSRKYTGIFSGWGGVGRGDFFIIHRMYIGIPFEGVYRAFFVPIRKHHTFFLVEIFMYFSGRTRAVGELIFVYIPAVV